MAIVIAASIGACARSAAPNGATAAPKAVGSGTTTPISSASATASAPPVAIEARDASVASAPIDASSPPATSSDAGAAPSVAEDTSDASPCGAGDLSLGSGAECGKDSESHFVRLGSLSRTGTSSRSELDVEIVSRPANLPCADDACGLRETVRQCYESALNATPALTGQVWLSLSIGAHGEVGAITQGTSAPALAAVADCVRTNTASTSLSCCTTDGAPAAVGMRIDLDPIAPDPAAGKPTIQERALQVNGRISPDVVRRILRQHYGQFTRCYENGLRANPTLQGSVHPKFVIGRDGAVAVAMDAGSDLPDNMTIQCVLATVRNLVFPRPEGGVVTAELVVTFARQ
jgi:hypothetical protein